MQQRRDVTALAREEKRLAAAAHVGDAGVVEGLKDRLHRIAVAGENGEVGKIGGTGFSFRAQFEGAAKRKNAMRDPAGFFGGWFVIISGGANLQDLDGRDGFAGKRGSGHKGTRNNAFLLVQKRFDAAQNIATAAEV